MTSIRTLSVEDLSEVAQIHIAAFPDSALSALGDRTIWRYYHWLLTGPHDAFMIGIWDKDSLEGFSFGGVFRGALTGFIKKNKWYLISQVLLRPWIVFKFQEAVDMSLMILRFRPFRKPKKNIITKPSLVKPIPSFGILAIAVHPEYQGKGLGKKMLNKSEKNALERNFTMMNLTVHQENKQAVDFYKKNGWEQWMGNNEVWQGKMIKKL